MAYSTSQRPGETDDQWYNRLAKVADQRLTRLEKLATQEGFKTADKWAYQSAMIDLETWNYGRTGDKMRFNRNKPEDPTQLKMKIADMRNFIDAPTSTKQGIVSSYKNRVDTFNRGNPDNLKGGYGTSFTWESLATYYNRGIADKLSKQYGSKTALKAIGKIQKLAKDKKKELAQAGRGTSNKNVLAQIRKDLENNPDTVTNMSDEVVQQILTDRSIPLSKLFED